MQVGPDCETQLAIEAKEVDEVVVVVVVVVVCLMQAPLLSLKLLSQLRQARVVGLALRQPTGSNEQVPTLVVKNPGAHLMQTLALACKQFGSLI